MKEVVGDDADTPSAAVRPNRGLARLEPWARFSLGTIVVWAGAGKILAPGAFANTLWSTGFFAKGVVPIVAYGLPAGEIVLGLALASSATAWLALPVLFAFATCFTLLHAYLLWTGTLVPCGCAGVSETHVNDAAHVRMLCVSAVMLLLSGALLIAQFHRPKTSQAPTKPAQDGAD